MKTTEKLESLRDYYVMTRQKGHTTLMKKGTDNIDEKLVLCYNKDQGRNLGFKNNEVVTLFNLKEQLIGNDKPLVVDNGAMTSLLEETLEKMYELEHENLIMKTKLRQISYLAK